MLWEPLLPGDTVGLIAPSSPVSARERRSCVKKLTEMGYRTVMGENLKKDENLHGYLAGTARARAEEINKMFARNSVKAVFCVRGGYGSSLLLPFLDYDRIGRNPKIFVGYSDVTSLHTVLRQKCGLVTFHGPMVKSNMIEDWDAYTERSLYRALNLGAEQYFENPPGEAFITIASGQAEGILIGGNLSVLARSLGTPYQPDTENSILFLEDVGESIPRIHMYLTQMKYARMLQRVRGILLGGFTDCRNPAKKEYLVLDFLKEQLSGLGIPVMGNVYSDHRKPMGTLPLGACCRMDTGGRGSIMLSLPPPPGQDFSLKRRLR